MTELAPTTFSIPTLETERMFLRGFRPEDVDAEIAFYATDRSAHVGGPLPAYQVWRVMASIIGHWALRGYGFWALEDKLTGDYLGRVGLWNPHGWPGVEIGWTLMDGAEGKSFAYEAALAVRDYAYGPALELTELISTIAPGNTRSEALARRLGAAPDGSFEHPTAGTLALWHHPRPQHGEAAR